MTEEKDNKINIQGEYVGRTLTKKGTKGDKEWKLYKIEVKVNENDQYTKKVSVFSNCNGFELLNEDNESEQLLFSCNIQDYVHPEYGAQKSHNVYFITKDVANKDIKSESVEDTKVQESPSGKPNGSVAVQPNTTLVCTSKDLLQLYLKKCKKEDRSCHDFIARYLFVNHRKKYDELTKEYESGTNAYPDGEELE